MTKEELEKEAEQYSYDVPIYQVEQQLEKIQKAYLAGAEPREKRIEHLEKSLLDVTEKSVKRIAELEEKVANLEYLLEGRDNEIDELKEQNTNLQTMLKAEREVRCNEEYLKRVTELEAEIEKMKEMPYSVVKECANETLRNENERLKAQIEKMKSCVNCRYCINEECPWQPKGCGMKHWELRR